MTKKKVKLTPRQLENIKAAIRYHEMPRKALEVLAEQKSDPRLWDIRTANEAYIQGALKHLHRIIEEAFV